MAKTNYILVNGRAFGLKPEVNVEEKIASLKAMGKTAMKCKAPPTIATLEKWSADGVAKATDGCRVEPDGECTHGHKSWMLVMGLI